MKKLLTILTLALIPAFASAQSCSQQANAIIDADPYLGSKREILDLGPFGTYYIISVIDLVTFQAICFSPPSSSEEVAWCIVLDCLEGS